MKTFSAFTVHFVYCNFWLDSELPLPFGATPTPVWFLPVSDISPRPSPFPFTLHSRVPPFARGIRIHACLVSPPSPPPSVPPHNLQDLRILTSHRTPADIDFITCGDTRRPPLAWRIQSVSPSVSVNPFISRAQNSFVGSPGARAYT